MDAYMPMYIKIQNYILNSIDNGLLLPGDKIPSENELSKQFNVSRTTTNKAISELSTRGIVVRVKGKGTFVKNNINTYVFSDNIKILSENLRCKEHSLIKSQIIKPTKEIQDKLSLAPDEEVYEFIRMMYNNNMPVAIDYSYIPTSILGDVTIQPEFIANLYLHEYLKNILDSKPKFLRIYINTKLPNTSEMKLLNIDKSIPLMIWDTHILNASEKIIALTITIARADQYKPFINFEI